jgi:hypothetical protein
MAKRPAYRKDYRRRAPIREPYDVVLIVCEGLKTEPFYLKRLQAVHQLSSANIKVMPAPGSDPMSIVTSAGNHVAMGEFDKIFCVFDRDGHQNYEAALGKISELSRGSPGRISAIISWPCFELWLLLHFTYSAKPFERTARASSCDRVITELKKHLPNYQKGRSSLYDELRPRQPTALAHAVRLADENRRTGAKNPATGMHELVDYLLKLRT